jgi:hypothetical protein
MEIAPFSVPKDQGGKVGDLSSKGETCQFDILRHVSTAFSHDLSGMGIVGHNVKGVDLLLSKNVLQPKNGVKSVR